MSFIKFGLDDIVDFVPNDKTTLKLSDIQSQENNKKPKRKRISQKNETSDDIHENEDNAEPTPVLKRKRLQINENDELNQEDITVKVEKAVKVVDTFKRRAKQTDDNEHLNETYGLYINKKAQRIVRHPLLPDFNKGQCSLENMEDFSYNIYPHCSMSEPRPIYFTKRQIENLETCFGRTMQHAHYKRRMSCTRTRYQNAWKTDRTLRKFEKKSVYHTSLFTFAERLECNPDPFFYGNYDFYYTGGNLCVLPTETHNVLHVDGSDFSTLKLSTCSIDCEPSVSSLQECLTTKLKTDTEIFEINSLENINQNHNLFATRQRNIVTMFSIDPILNQMIPLVELKTKFVPFISFAQSLEKPELLVLSTMKQNLQIYNVNHTENIIKENSYKMCDKNSSSLISWNRIIPFYGETFIYANEHELSLIDFRAPQNEWLKIESSFSSNEFPCEANSSIAASEFNNLLYIGTTHKLRCVDTRFLNQRKNFESMTVCEWTHALNYSPTFLNVIRNGNREYIACSSPVPGDLRICELVNKNLLEIKQENPQTLRNCDFESHCLPWQPPTLQEAYENACLTGKVLQPEANLQQRIEACTTGIAFLKTKNFERVQAFFLHANSNGDVYAQTMQFGEQNDNVQKRTSKQSDQVMEDYAKELCKIPQLNLNYTDVVDMKGIRKVLLCPNLRNKQIKIEEDSKEKTQDSNLKYIFKGRWQKSVSSLHTYKDALAKDILSIWDIPYEDEVDIKYSELKKKFNAEKSEKDILNWLNKNDEQAPTTSIPMSNLSAIEMEESTNIVDFSFTENSGLLNESTIIENTSWTAAKPKSAKPKKKHVKGF